MEIQQEKNKVAYSEVVKRLLRHVPEISDVYQQEQMKWGSQPIPLDVVYGSIFSDFLRQVVVKGKHESGHSRSEIIRRSFQLIEELAQSADFQTRCVAEVSVLESLLGQDKEDWQRFSPYFGKQTLEMALKLAEKWELPVGSRKR